MEPDTSRPVRRRSLCLGGLMVPHNKKYFTDTERKAARAAANSRWWQSHRIVCRVYNQRWWQNNKHRYKRNNRILQAYKQNTGCELCGYAFCGEAIDFHHVIPDDKSFGMCSSYTRPLPKIIQESFKCAVLCSCCHREVEAGRKSCPIKLAPAYASA